MPNWDKCIEIHYTNRQPERFLVTEAEHQELTEKMGQPERVQLKATAGGKQVDLETSTITSVREP